MLTCWLTKVFQVVTLMSFFVLGIWQLISAIVNTVVYRKNTKIIAGLKIYWVLVALVGIISAIALNYELPGKSTGFYTLLASSSVCAIVYLVIYYLKLIKEDNS